MRKERERYFYPGEPVIVDWGTEKKPIPALLPWGDVYPFCDIRISGIEGEDFWKGDFDAVRKRLGAFGPNGEEVSDEALNFVAAFIKAHKLEVEEEKNGVRERVKDLYRRAVDAILNLPTPFGFLGLVLTMPS